MWNELTTCWMAAAKWFWTMQIDDWVAQLIDELITPTADVEWTLLIYSSLNYFISYGVEAIAWWGSLLNRSKPQFRLSLDFCASSKIQFDQRKMFTTPRRQNNPRIIKNSSTSPSSYDLRRPSCERSPNLSLDVSIFINKSTKNQNNWWCYKYASTNSMLPCGERRKYLLK